MTAAQCAAFEARWLAACAAYDRTIAPARAAMMQALDRARQTGEALPGGLAAAYRRAAAEALCAFTEVMDNGADTGLADYLDSRVN
jgi:hypothetical protein